MPEMPDSKNPSGQTKSAFGPKSLAIAASALWVGAVLGYRFTFATESGVFAPLMTALAPLGPLYLAMRAQEALQNLRQEADALQTALSALKAKSDAKAAEEKAPIKPPEPRHVEIRPAVRAAVNSALKREPIAQQPTLALDTPEDAPPLPRADLIRALQFPESQEDHAGIQSLRLALKTPEIARLIRSAQDMLMLLSQEGVFMDNLSAGSQDAVLWRRFISGERGPDMAAIGEIGNPLALELTTKRLHEDPVFRDAAHHFLRGYDRLLQSLLAEASDQELAQLAQTRSARAFALCARAIGVFD